MCFLCHLLSPVYKSLLTLCVRFIHREPDAWPLKVIYYLIYTIHLASRRAMISGVNKKITFNNRLAHCVQKKVIREGTKIPSSTTSSTLFVGKCDSRIGQRILCRKWLVFWFFKELFYFLFIHTHVYLLANKCVCE